jgi:hypothetical protein
MLFMTVVCQSTLHPKLRNINPLNVTHFLISRRERIFEVRISLLIVTFLSLISWNLSLMQTTKEVNPHPHIAPCVNMWSVTFFIFFWWMCRPHRLGRPSGVDHTSVGDWRTISNCPHISFVLFHNVTCYTYFVVPCIHVNTTKLRNITCTMVATCVILRTLECIYRAQK